MNLTDSAREARRRAVALCRRLSAERLRRGACEAAGRPLFSGAAVL